MKASESDIKDFMAQRIIPTGSDEPAPESPAAGDTPKPTETARAEAVAEAPEVTLPSDAEEDLNTLSKEELIKRLTERAEAAKEESPEAETDGAAGEPAEEAPEVSIESISSSEGFLTDNEFAHLSDLFQAEGSLPEEAFDALANRGIPKEYVQQYIAGVTAMQEKFEAEIHGAAGGKESYAELLSWAATALTPDEISRFNDAVTSGDQGRALDAVRGLAARSGKGASYEPKATAARKVSPAVQAGYTSKMELQRDMQDPRYMTDPIYQKNVEAKLARSDLSALR